MAKKYLDLDGLSHFWQAIKNAFVADVTYNSSTKKIQKTKAGTASDVVTLSTVATSGSYSDLSNKPTIPTIPNNFGIVKVGSTNVEADTTRDTLELAAGANVVLSPDATNDKVTIGTIFYGTSNTAAATTTKDVTATGFALVSGALIAVKFTVTNTGAVASLQLNVNSTGAKSIKYRGGNLPSAGTLTANRVYLFVYDGTNYELIGDLDTNTTYSAGTAALINAGTDTANRVWQAKILHDYMEGLIPESDVFVATFNETAFLDIQSAVTSGKVVVCVYPTNNTVYLLTGCVLTGQADDRYVRFTNASTTIFASHIVAIECRYDSNRPNYDYTQWYEPNTYELAMINSPALTGTPTAPTATAGTNTTQIATTAFVTTAVNNGKVAKTTTTPKMDGTAAVGSETKYAAGDHVHPTDTSRAPLASPALTGTPTAPTASSGTNNTQIATTAFVNSAVSGATTYTSFTGKPTANQTPGFGSTFTISQISQSTTGQVSGTDRTIKIPNATATTSAAGLMSSADKTKLDGISGNTLDIVAGSNVTITPDTTNNTLTISSTDTNTTYTSGTASELNTGTATGVRVWSPKIIADYVKTTVETAVTGAAAFQGTAPTSFAPTTYKAGYYWVVGTAGTYVGQVCEPGDMIFAIADGTSYSASNFDVVQTNLDITSITNAEIDTIVAA